MLIKFILRMLSGAPTEHRPCRRILHCDVPPAARGGSSAFEADLAIVPQHPVRGILIARPLESNLTTFDIVL